MLEGMAQLTPSSLRAARAFLAWSQRDLAEHSCVSRAAIEAIENESAARSVRPATVAKLIATFAAHGAAIIPPPADGVVRIPRG